MHFLKTLSIASLCYLLVACANVAEGPMYSPENALQPGETGIYVYTTHQGYRFISSMGPALYIDGKLIGDLPNHGYFYTKLSPGEHKASIRYKHTVLTSRTNEVAFFLGNKQIKYFAGKWGKSGRQYMMSDFMMHDDYEWKLVEEPREIGENEVKNLPLSLNKP